MHQHRRLIILEANRKWQTIRLRNCHKIMRVYCSNNLIITVNALFEVNLQARLSSNTITMKCLLCVYYNLICHIEAPKQCFEWKAVP